MSPNNPLEMAYPRACVKCGQSIIMSELSPGRWQPWEPDGRNRHECKLGQAASIQALSSLSSPNKLLGKSETHLTRCPWCRQHVYYHTNGNGDCVYFDSIGYPWQIHPCWEEHWKGSKDRQRVLKKLLKQNNPEQQKLRILAGVLKSVSKVVHGTQEVYKTSEANLARFLGISIEELRQEYSHLYMTEVQGIKLCSFLTKNEASKTSKLLSTDLNSELISCHRCGQMIWKRKLADHLRSSHPLLLKTCTFCNKKVSKDSFEQHLIKCQVQRKKARIRSMKHASHKPKQL